MAYAIVLYPDQETQERIRGIWSELARCGISDHMLASHWRPHVSLAVFNQLYVPDVEEKLRALAANTPSFPVLSSSIGIFPGEQNVLFLSPVVSDDLIRIHRQLHELVRAYRDQEREFYLEDRWVPHCTLAERLPQSLVGRAAEVCARIPMPIAADMTQIGLVEFRPVKELCTLGLIG